MFGNFCDSFVYKPDKKYWDSWRILTKDADGKYRGDCDDFAITSLYFLEGESLFRLWVSLIFKSSKIVYCTGADDFSHAVLRYEGKYIDNIYKEWLTQEQLEERGYVFHSWLFPWPISMIKMFLGIFR